MKYIISIIILITLFALLSCEPNFNYLIDIGGLKIAFQSDRDGNDEIYVMNADGSNQERLTYNAVADFYPCWSPDIFE